MVFSFHFDKKDRQTRPFTFIQNNIIYVMLTKVFSIVIFNHFKSLILLHH